MKMENKVCKNKNCLKPLPDGYKHKYCEACRNQQAQKVKNGLKAAAGIAGTDWNLLAKESNLVFCMGKGMAGNLQKRKSKRPDLLLHLSGQCRKVLDSVLWSNASANDSAN